MLPSIVVKESEDSGVQYLYGEGNALYSINPPESLFGYTVWSHMVPPFLPKHSLILGYGGGTVSALMRKVWGQCKVTGVDLDAHNHNYIENKIKVMDAKDFIWEATTPAFKDYLFTKEKYDYICIDLWNGNKVCDFVFNVEFVVRLRELATGLVCINVKAEDVPRMKAYNDYGFKFDRSVSIEGNIVCWWSLIK